MKLLELGHNAVPWPGMELLASGYCCVLSSCECVNR